MKIKRMLDRLGRTGYEVELSDYDSLPPNRYLLAYDLPSTIDADREAIALYLVFGPWCGGEFFVPKEISPHTSATITRDSLTVPFQPQPIAFAPKALPSGKNVVHISLDPRGGGKHNSITILPNHTWLGCLRSPHSLTLSSNAFVFQQEDNDFVPLLGVCVLYAEFLDVDSLVLPPVFDTDQFSRLSSLLSSVNLGLALED